MVLLLSMQLSGCIGTVVGAAVDTTIEVIKVPFKVVGAAADVVTGNDLIEQGSDQGLQLDKSISDVLSVEAEVIH